MNIIVASIVLDGIIQMIRIKGKKSIALDNIKIKANNVIVISKLRQIMLL